jgi:integrase
MEELRAVWQCAEGLEYPFGPYFLLLILTGARRSEWACSRRAWLDPLVSRLEIPAHAYKTDRPYVIPLSALARRIIMKLPAHQGGAYSFSTTAGEHPISGFSKAKARIDTFLAENGLAADSWVTHDLRRTMATHMERLGIAPHVIEACFGHSLRGIAAVYRQYQYLPEKQAAYETWAQEVTAESAVTAHPVGAAQNRELALHG